MIADIQPTEIIHVEDRAHFFRFLSLETAELKAKEIGGVVLKEQGQDIWYVFPEVPKRTIGWIEQ